ncbi:RagB/SusD family nutrient uptake outer membrane protein [Flavobacterium zhairuonense]|uniref:RagB/SusD family nutrient uptake outer membrane protein n=1 Tax=Flavobacterium zhairuonense TaxID=2493631 RepID=UPI0010441926|nr:RagB/SusD family nutrient uptake outer membrane protein [Flavobacterium zhairuonense]KAF2514709.1 RagB/SusD family nutrient uptake outer membrane protein [Flavobacterium zhairuonense]
MKNKKILSIIACSLLMFSSCTELDDNVYSTIANDQFNPSEGDLASLIGPAYTQWRTLYANRPGWWEMQETSADEIIYPGRPNGWVDGGIYKQVHQHIWTSLQPQLQTVWNQAYGGIAQANKIIYQIESGQIPVSQGKEQLIAEIRMVRASYYYVLCDLFGNVPVQTSFIVEPGYLPEQKTRKQVFDFIVTEVKESMPSLSQTVGTSTYGRFTQWGAHALLAKMYLNAEVYTGTPMYNECIQESDIIIASGKFALAASVRDAFSPKNENSPETIWAIPYDEVKAGGLQFWMLGSWDSQRATYNSNVGGWGGMGVLPQFINSFDPQDDRLIYGFRYGLQSGYDGKPLTAGYGADAGKPFILRNTMPTIDLCQQLDGYQINKYSIELGIQQNMNNDAPFFRYTDVLMMKAESLLRTGNSAAAATIVSQVRARSFSSNPAKATVTGAQLLLGSVYNYGVTDNKMTATTEGGADIQYGRFLDELAWEFNQEGRRRQDMIRFGVFFTKSWFAHQKTNKDYLKIYPIPQQELQKNSKLVQNPGY